MEIFRQELKTIWNVVCPNCGCEILNKNGKFQGRQRFICIDCGLSFTTYSKTALHSSKIGPEKWDHIINLFLNDYTLSNMSEETKISIQSLSKIRIKLLTILYKLNDFENIIRSFVHKHNNDSSFFKEDTDFKKGKMFYFKMKGNILLLYKPSPKELASMYIDEEYLKKLITDDTVYIDFIDAEETEDLLIHKYINRLCSYIKKYRGVKKEHLHLYINYFNLRCSNSNEYISDYIIENIGHTKKAY